MARVTPPGEKSETQTEPTPTATYVGLRTESLASTLWLPRSIRSRVPTHCPLVTEASVHCSAVTQSDPKPTAMSTAPSIAGDGRDGVGDDGASGVDSSLVRRVQIPATSPTLTASPTPMIAPRLVIRCSPFVVAPTKRRRSHP